MQAGQPPPPRAARVASSGVLIDAGLRALVPSAAVEGATRVWVRDGLGRTTEASRDDARRGLEPFGVAVLRLAAPLAAADAMLAPRDPFAGSAGHAIEYAASADAVPSWPSLHQGFFGAFEGRDGLRRLGIALLPGSHGGPVFDAAGRLAGIALPGHDGQGLLLPASMLRAALPAVAPPPERSAGATTRMPIDEVYEHALRVALQVLALP